MSDKSDLSRFLTAQEKQYGEALEELRRGRKQSHWIWFVFPQLIGLGQSATANYYGISGMKEARAYLAHPLLSARLNECTDMVLAWAGEKCVREIFGELDAMKLKSSMTLFEAAAGHGNGRFARVLDSCFDGARDARTLAMLDDQLTGA